MLSRAKNGAHLPKFSQKHCVGVLFSLGVVSGKVYAGICRGSPERRHQTTAGSRVMCMCYGCMLKFIWCMSNKLAGSSDIGFADNRHRYR